MGTEHGMIFNQMVGNYTPDSPTSFTEKIASRSRTQVAPLLRYFPARFLSNFPLPRK